MFRCPTCATVTKLKLTGGHSLLANPQMTHVWLAKEPISIPSMIEKADNEITAIAKLLEKHGLEVERNEKDEIECMNCNAFHPFQDWNNAWTYPGDYFDADQLCWCGGEFWFDHVPGTRSYAPVCDSCGLVKQGKRISGSEQAITN